MAYPLPAILTEAEWKNHKSVFQNETKISAHLRELAKFCKDLDPHFVEHRDGDNISKQSDLMMRASIMLKEIKNRADETLAKCGKAPLKLVVKKAQVDYVKRLGDEAVKLRKTFGTL